MARPKKAMVDYFPHYCNHKKTIMILKNQFKNDGYAFWFQLLEMLGTTEHHYLDCNNIHTWMFLLTKTLVNEEIATKILDLLAELDAIDKELWNKGIIRSQNFIDNLEDVYRRREVNVLTKQEVINQCLHKLPLSGQNDNINPQSKTKEVKQSKTKEVKQNCKSIDKRHLDLQLIIDYASQQGFSLQGSTKENRQYAYNLFRKKDIDGKKLGVEKVKQLIDMAIACRGEQYAPMINDFKQLFYKFLDLMSFIERKRGGGRIG